MSLVVAQFEKLREDYPNAVRQDVGDGSFVITVPSVAIPDGWTAKEATIRFVVPVGYPMARPDCFWTDDTLILSDGRVPQNTGTNSLPLTPPIPQRWYSWHLVAWSPNSDTLTTYLNVIRKRFAELR